MTRPSEEAATHAGPRAVAGPGASAGGAQDQAAGRPPALPRAVLEGVRARRPDAMAAFFERYFDLVHGITCRLLGERTAAEDLTQEVFYKIHRAAHTLDAGRDPGPWVVGITYNACRDLWRSRGFKLARRSTSLDAHEGLHEAMRSPAGDPADRFAAAERQRRVREAVAGLPDRLREVVVLHDFGGLGHDEIAARLGATHDAVRKRYSRALAALAARLGDVLE